jgi:hypothetical protein
MYIVYHTHPPTGILVDVIWGGNIREGGDGREKESVKEIGEKTIDEGKLELIG